MTILFGILLLLSLFAIGRDGRVLPVHGFCAALCAASMGQGLLALASAALLLGCNIAAWFGLRRLAPDIASARGIFSPVVMAVIGAMALVLLLALAALPGLPVLMGAAVVLIGLCGATLASPLLQFVGMLAALNGLMLLAGGLGNGMLLSAAAMLWAALATLGFWLLPRMAWLRADPIDDV